MIIINCSEEEIMDSIRNREKYKNAEREGRLHEFLLSWRAPFLSGEYAEKYRIMEEKAPLGSLPKNIVTTPVVNLGDGLIVDAFQFVLESRFLFDGYYYMTDGFHAYSVTKDMQNTIQAINMLIRMNGGNVD